MSEYSLLRELYETQRKLPNRNFAHGHGFEGWVANRNWVLNQSTEMTITDERERCAKEEKDAEV